MCLKSHPAYETPESNVNFQVQKFLKEFIKVDGVFVLRMVAAHAGVMFCTELTENLWNRYLSQQAHQRADRYVGFHGKGLLESKNVKFNF